MEQNFLGGRKPELVVQKKKGKFLVGGVELVKFSHVNGITIHRDLMVGFVARAG